MFAVDRQQGCARPVRGVDHQRAGGDQRFLVCKGDGLACIDGGHRRSQSSAADDRGNDDEPDDQAADDLDDGGFGFDDDGGDSEE